MVAHSGSSGGSSSSGSSAASSRHNTPPRSKPMSSSGDKGSDLRSQQRHTPRGQQRSGVPSQQPHLDSAEELPQQPLPLPLPQQDGEHERQPSGHLQWEQKQGAMQRHKRQEEEACQKQRGEVSSTATAPNSHRYFKRMQGVVCIKGLTRSVHIHRT